MSDQSSSLERLKETLSDLLFPRICRSCGSTFEEGHSNILCSPCFDSVLPYQEPCCDHCGISLPARGFEDSQSTRCADCGEGTYHLQKVKAWGPYVGPLRILHHAFKFEGMEGLKREIADRSFQTIPSGFWEGVEALVPVPMSPEKERERGYNPSFLMGQELSRIADIPSVQLLKKIRKTPPQMALSKTQRLKNPAGAYAVSQGSPLPHKLVLVDDVFTTGATLEECAKILREAGVQWVGAVVFGRTPHQI